MIACATFEISESWMRNIHKLGPIFSKHIPVDILHTWHKRMHIYTVLHDENIPKAECWVLMSQMCELITFTIEPKPDLIEFETIDSNDYFITQVVRKDAPTPAWRALSEPY